MQAADEIVTRGAKAYVERDLDGLAQTWHPDVVYEEDPLWPGAGTFRGRAAVLARFREYEEQLGAGTVAIDEVVQTANGLVLTFRHAGETTGAGVPFEHRWAWVVRLRDGKAAHIRAHFDPDEALHAAGAEEQ